MPSSYGDIEIKSNSLFLKIVEGSPQEIRLLDETPTEVMKHSDGKQTVICKGSGCEWCAEGKKPRQRWITNVYNHTTGRVQLFEYGAQVAKAFQAIAKSAQEEETDIMDIDLKIEVQGSRLETKYSVTPRRTAPAKSAARKPSRRPSRRTRTPCRPGSPASCPTTS